MTTSTLESMYFIYLCLLCHFISCCNVTLVCHLFFGHVYLLIFLTMEVFTTSWWVVNQSIVAIILLYASTGYKLIYPTLGGVKPLFWHNVALFVSYPWWGDTSMLILLLLLLLLSYSQVCSRVCLYYCLGASCLPTRGSINE